MSRKFKVGDVIYSTRDVEEYGMDMTRLFTVVALGDMEYANGPAKPFVTIKSNCLPTSQQWSTYEEDWTLLKEGPMMTDDGAREYEDAMRGLDLVKIES